MSLKDSFPHNNVHNFVIDSTLQDAYKMLPKTNNSFLDSIAGNMPTYFYSWQEQDTLTNEFTIVSKPGERGTAIFYLIFNKKDNLLSATQIAGSGGEGGYLYETRSKFITKDTLESISAVTDFYDYDIGINTKKTKGDSTFFYLTVLKDGKI